MDSPRKEQGGHDSGGHGLAPQSGSPPRPSQSGLSSMPNTPPRSRSGSQLAKNMAYRREKGKENVRLLVSIKGMR